LIVEFIDSSVVGTGFGGYYGEYFFNRIIILSMIGHRFTSKRIR